MIYNLDRCAETAALQNNWRMATWLNRWLATVGPTLDKLRTDIGQTSDKLWANLVGAFELQKLSKTERKIHPGRPSGVQNRSMEVQIHVLRVRSRSEFQKIHLRSQL